MEAYWEEKNNCENSSHFCYMLTEAVICKCCLNENSSHFCYMLTEAVICKFCLKQAFLKKETPALVFSCKICESFKSTVFTKHLQWLLYLFQFELFLLKEPGYRSCNNLFESTKGKANKKYYNYRKLRKFKYYIRKSRCVLEELIGRMKLRKTNISQKITFNKMYLFNFMKI